MNRTAQTHRSIDSQSQSRRRARHARRLAIAALAAAGIALSAPLPSVSGASPCDEYRPTCDAQLCECGNCGCSDPMKQTPIYRTLDTLAGGIEKALGLDRCGSQHCDTLGCDSLCCDAASMDIRMLEPMVPPKSSATPLQEVLPETRRPTAPESVTPPTRSPRTLPAPRSVRPTLPVAPPLDVEPLMTEPRIVTPDAIPTTPKTAPAPIEFKPIEPNQGQPSMQLPVQPLEPTPKLPAEPNDPKPKQDRSIFDQLDDLDNEDLDDPFKEDAVRLESIYGGVRHSKHHRTAAKIPPYRPLYQNRNAQPIPLPMPPSMRNAAPIGSGLRPAQHVQPLRPVSHETPSTLTPLSNQRVLAPYRRSR